MKELKKVIKPQLIQVQSQKNFPKHDSKKLNSSMLIDTTASMQSIEKVIRNSAKKINPETIDMYQSTMSIAKYISPKNQKVYT